MLYLAIEKPDNHQVMSKKYKPIGKIGLFDKQFAAQQLREMGNPLEAISKVVDFEFFRPILEEKLLNTNKKNNGDDYYGYKNHIKIDGKSKLIDTYMVSDASVHDSKVLDMLLTEEDENQPLYADSAYTGAKLEQAIMEHKMSNQVCEKGYRNNPLTTEQQANNRIKSKTRARVEHVFGFMEQSMRGLYIWSIGLPRATGILGLINLTYNIFRYKQLIRRTA